MSIQLTKKAKEIIDGKNFGSIATLMHDNSPQVTPVWIDREDNLILVNTALGRVKQKNITKDPRVAISIVDQQNPYTMVSIRGRVIAQIEQGAEDHIDTLAKKYLGQDKYTWRQPGEKRVILKIQPETIFEI
jgi:PPOX class probable F420-dependent enzyme